jgi:hypothetical protein
MPSNQRPVETAARDALHVVVRFAIRMAILIGLACIARIGFSQACPRLLLLAGLFCALWALLQGENMLGPTLTHWDEAAWLVIASRLAAAMA